MSARLNVRTHHPSQMSQRNQKGSVAVFVALVFSSVLLLLGAFVVDIGSQRVGRSDMQALADVVALDMSRLVDGSTVHTIEARPSWSATLAQSVARNDTTVGSAPRVTATLGTVDTATGSFAVSADGDVPNAVRISAQTSVAFAFGFLRHGGTTRSAVGAATSTACFRLGSYAARLSTASSPLLASLVQSALGGSVRLSAASYSGLAGADVSLAALAGQLGLGRTDELASTDVAVPDLLRATAEVLRQDGDTADVALLNGLAGQVGPLPPVSLGGLFHVTAGSGAAETATVDALDLVTGAAFLANGNAMAIPDLSTRLPLSGTALTTSVKVIEGAQTACGTVGTTASTSQVDLTVTGQPAALTTPSSLSGLSLSAAAGSTSVAVHLAPATGTLASIVCGDGTTTRPEGVDVTVASQLATVTDVRQTIGVAGTLSSSSLLGGLLGGVLGNVASVSVTGTLQLSAHTDQAVATRTARVRVPIDPTTYGSPVPTGSGTLGIDSATAAAEWTSGPTLTAKTLFGTTITLNASQTATVLNGIVSDLLTEVWTPLATAVDTQLVGPLSDLLGLSLGGADVYGVPRPSCSSPALVG